MFDRARSKNQTGALLSGLASGSHVLLPGSYLEGFFSYFYFTPGPVSGQSFARGRSS